MNANFVTLIGSSLLKAAIKSYAGGIAGITKLNRHVLKAEAITYTENGPVPHAYTFGGRDLLKVDYTVTDIEALNNFRNEAFTVAGVGSYELQERLKEEGLDIWTNGGQDQEEFIKRARQIIRNYVPDKEAPPGGWLQTNLNTAIGSSYHAAQYIKITDPDIKDLYPAWQYKTRNDTRVRPAHAALADKIFYNNDARWQAIYPPNDWNCRCFVLFLDRESAGRLEVEEPLKGRNAMQQFLAETEIPDEFMRNPGETKSIWSKWLSQKFSEKDFVTAEQLNGKMKKYASGIEARRSELEYSKEDVKTINDEIREVNIKDDVYPDYTGTKVIISLPEAQRKEVARLVKDPDEVWGKTTNTKGVTGSVTNYITFTKGGIIISMFKDGKLVKVERASLENIDKFRPGTMIRKKVWS